MKKTTKIKGHSDEGERTMEIEFDIMIYLIGKVLITIRIECHVLSNCPSTCYICVFTDIF